MATITFDTCHRDSFHLACCAVLGPDGMATVFERTCAYHAKLGWTALQVHQENQRKNIAISALCDAKKLDLNAVSWAIDQDTRELSLDHPAASPADTKLAIAAADIQKPLPKVASLVGG